MRPDVLILGDGVAGLSCAITACQSGFKTTVLKPATKVEDSLYVVLHPGAEPLFDVLGIAEQADMLALSRPKGYWQHTGKDHRFISYLQGATGSWYGYVLILRHLEDLLATRARALGVEFADRPSQPDMLFSDGKVRGLNCAGRDFLADLTIDASGGRQFLPRKLGLKPLYGSPPLIAVYASGLTNKTLRCPSFHQWPDGWRFRIGIGAGRISTIDVKIATHKVSAENRHCRDVTWRYLPECAGPGYAVIGDAALRLDPASGAGVLRAMMMGIKAPELAKHPDSWRQYRQWVRDWAFEDGTKLAEIYAAPPFQVTWPQYHCWSAERPSHTGDVVRVPEMEGLSRR